MSPGRASSALTILRPLAPCWALCTQVATAPQPPPGILCPACSSDQVTKLAHHGLPGGTPAAARYWLTWGPVLEEPISCTCSWVWACWSAESPNGLPPPEEGTAAAGSIGAGTAWGFGASMLAGPAGAVFNPAAGAAG